MAMGFWQFGRFGQRFGASRFVCVGLLALSLFFWLSGFPHRR